MARFVRQVVENYPVTVTLHTDHCPLAALDAFLHYLQETDEDKLRSSPPQLGLSHRWDRAALAAECNIEVSRDCLRSRELGAFLDTERPRP